MNISESEANSMTFEGLLHKDGYIVYTTVGTSMRPLLRTRKDIVEIRKKGPDRCRKYDVVLYKRGEKYILHRILEILPDGKYIIAGDNTTFLEKDITDDRILGVMTRIIRDGKSINVDDPSYQRYVHLWCDAYPARMRILKVRNKARSGLSKVKRILS